MSRVEPVDWESDARYATLVSEILSQRDRIGQLYPILMHSTPVVHGILACGTALRHQTELPAQLREMAIVVVGVINGARYEVFRHVEVATALGVPATKLDALVALEFDNRFTPAERAALEYTRRLTEDVSVDNETYAAVRDQFDATAIVELTVIASYYNMVSRVLVALEIGEEPDPNEK